MILYKYFYQMAKNLMLFAKYQQYFSRHNKNTMCYTS